MKNDMIGQDTFRQRILDKYIGKCIYDKGISLYMNIKEIDIGRNSVYLKGATVRNGQAYSTIMKNDTIMASISQFNQETLEMNDIKIVTKEQYNKALLMMKEEVGNMEIR